MSCVKKKHFGSGFRFLAGPGFNEYRMDPKHCFTFAETTNQFSCERCNYRSTFCGLCLLQSSSIFSLCVFSLTKPRFNDFSLDPSSRSCSCFLCGNRGYSII